MSIDNLIVFSETGEKSTSGLTQSEGFPRDEKPARAWFNFLFNGITVKINELITNVNKLLLFEHYRVDDVYVTTKNHASAAAVATYFGYGTWERYAEGKTLVGLSDNASDPAWTKTIGSEEGEYETELTVDQLPPISFTVDIHKGNIEGETRAGLTTTSASPANIETNTLGEGEAHNNVQPSKVAAFWVRTA